MGNLKLFSICGIVSLLVMFALGYFVCGIFGTAWIYRNEISTSDFLNLVVTCIVTLFAAWYIASKINEDRYAKELTISDLREIECNISQIILKAQETDGNDVIRSVIPLINQLQVLLTRLEKTCSINGEKVPITNIKNKFYCFFGCATNFEGEPLNLPLITLTGDELIVEIRQTISKINRM